MSVLYYRNTCSTCKRNGCVRCAYCGACADDRPVRYEAQCWKCWADMVWGPLDG